MMNSIALDDEPLALNIIEGFCKKIGYINFVAKCTNAVDAVKILYEQDIDLIFLDIEMPNITGLEFIKTLPNPPMVIITTAYSSYALDGFDLNAIDYLVKPISFERFFKAVNKAYELLHFKQGKNFSIPPLPVKDLSHLMVKVEYETVNIHLDDIIYIEGLKDYVKIQLVNKSLMTKSTMKNIELKLPSSHFVRVHKSFIVALSRIVSINNNRILIGDKRIPVGNQYRKKFNDILKKLQL